MPHLGADHLFLGSRPETHRPLGVSFHQEKGSSREELKSSNYHKILEFAYDTGSSGLSSYPQSLWFFSGERDSALKVAESF